MADWDRIMRAADNTHRKWFALIEDAESKKYTVGQWLHRASQDCGFCEEYTCDNCPVHDHCSWMHSQLRKIRRASRYRVAWVDPAIALCCYATKVCMGIMLERDGQ